jgi:hypothetical protein
MTCDCDILKPKALCLTCANHICALFPKPCLLRKKFQSEGICLDYTKKTSLDCANCESKLTLYCYQSCPVTHGGEWMPTVANDKTEVK